MRKTFALLTLTLFSVCGCTTEPKFERNPNLYLLVPVEGGMTCFNPVVSADGNTVYYLRGKMKTGSMEEEEPASLWAVDVDGGNNRLVKDGRFGALAISPDGQRLAVTKDASFFEGGLLALMDTSGGNEAVIQTSSQNVLDVEFSSNGSTLFYFADTAFYCIGIDGENEQFLFRGSKLYGFDISPGDSIIFYYGRVSSTEMGGAAHFLKDGSEKLYGHNGFNPQFHPTDSRYLVFPPGWHSAGFYLKVLDLVDGSRTSLNAQTYPYNNTFGFPCWSPDGSYIVFSSSGTNSIYQLGRGIGATPPVPIPFPFELWVLGNVSY